ncbi:putative TATA-box binding protein [Gregarina niphandrodes]|uniref:TATA-box binding protein n=1 Tax=Gregarina niphandrodes TaxID=110365 RepID=A0A023B3P3_GRENI|nr:putative TATA-box binding protein [Gregarina niphandrodes]EZG55863.1 putative TATA-box binding protein [Gregarina niphandrodes]|eukprot:XP_011131434.1 putative TATA-box binding protein [Gregarina niphandrodes]
MDFDGGDFECEDYDPFQEDENTLGFAEEGTDVLAGGPMISCGNATAEALSVEQYQVPAVRVVNCVVAFYTGCQLDLRLVTVSTRNVEYNPRKLNAAVVRFVDPRLTASVFPNGRVTLAGRASLPAIKKTAKTLAKLLQKSGHPEVTFNNFKICTLVCTANCGFPVRLENIAQDHGPFCSYEPEIFCGLVYRFNPRPELKATALIFVSGRMVISGCTSPRDANEVFHSLYAVLYRYRA